MEKEETNILFQKLKAIVFEIEVNYRTQGWKESWENYYKQVEKYRI